METWLIYMHKIKDDLKNALRTVSFTTDGWSDTTIFPFIAVTAHWVERESNSPDPGLRMRAAVISFYGLPISHTGTHLAHALANILERVEVIDNIGYITLDNASNNNVMLKDLETIVGRCRFNAKENHIW
ncbi:hypothetical protein PM082_007195 [Marasmius tenuissimus]|nr:hypothetical protein PM082_007195 [Marasmius tenuissimus]